MQLNPYLTFKGQCEAAFKFYEKVLGGKIEAMIPHEGTPAAEHVPTEWRNKIMHARLVLGDRDPDGLRRSARALRGNEGVLGDARHR